jgi:uncharacterized repeat protein (TIGR03847 family)
MSESYDLGPVERITAGAVGEPGDRTFFVQARAGAQQVTILTEKDQVRALAEALGQLLTTLPDGDEGRAPADAELELASPLEPAWRAGEMSVEYDDDSDRIAIVLTEMQEEDAPDIAGRARFEATRAQVRAMVQHALAVVAAGRPRCQLCGFPMEAGGMHMCPAMNGHRSYRDE